MVNLMERVRENPELQRKLTEKMFQLGWIGESDCVRQNELNAGKDGTIFLQHPVKDCPLTIAIRDVPAEYQPITDNSSVKIKVRPDVHEGHLAGDVVGADCFAQNIEAGRVKERQDIKYPNRKRRIETLKNLTKKL